MSERGYSDADIELIARAEFDLDQRRLVATMPNPAGFEPTPWTLPTLSQIRETYRQRARAALDALAQHGQGLAPVIAHQWSVRYPDGFVDGTAFTEAGARQRAADLNGEVVYRAVGPWQPAP